MNKRGSFSDVVYFIVAIIVIAIIILVCYKILYAYNTSVQGGNLISDQGKTMTQSLTDRYVAINDAAFFIIFVGLIIGIGVGAYFIYTHPALLFISLPIVAFLIFLAAIFGNTTYQIFNSNEFINEYQQFSILSFVFDNFLPIMTVVVLLITLILFIKPAEPEFQ